jgi:hypothetical protein
MMSGSAFIQALPITNSIPRTFFNVFREATAFDTISSSVRTLRKQALAVRIFAARSGVGSWLQGLTSACAISFLKSSHSCMCSIFGCAFLLTLNVAQMVDHIRKSCVQLFSQSHLCLWCQYIYTYHTSKLRRTINNNFTTTYLDLPRFHLGSHAHRLCQQACSLDPVQHESLPRIFPHH